MSSPKERSEARRKALLSRGNDRLKKLTSSARGEDAPQFLHDDPPLVAPLKSFIGESTPEPAQTPSPAPSLLPAAGTDWSPEELRRAMESLGTLPGLPPTSTLPQPPRPNRLGALHKHKSASSTLLQRLSPLLSLLVPLTILLYFVTLHEPTLYNSLARIGNDHWSVRWSSLASFRGSQRMQRSEVVHPVPFFTTFISVQLLQELLDLALVPSGRGMPSFLTLISPHLPPSVQRWIIRLLFCVNVVTSLLDYTAVSVFGIGVVIWGSGMLSN